MTKENYIIVAKNYIIVVGDVTGDMNDFLKEVNTKIDEGYIPCGGVTFREDSVARGCYYHDYFYQAMILKEKE